MDSTKTDVDRQWIALSNIAVIANAMKAHPNEPVVQDKRFWRPRSWLVLTESEKSHSPLLAPLLPLPA
jgi:hypothetical protein